MSPTATGAWWDELSGSELRRRLIQRGMDAVEAFDLVMRRDHDADARATIHAWVDR